MSNIIKKDDKSGAIAPASSFVKGKLKSVSSPFQQRARQAQSEAANADTLPNRLTLMLDSSTSMADYAKGRLSKMDLLHQAIDNFVGRCNLGDTAIAIETFPPSVELALTNISVHIVATASSVQPSGNTPLHECIERCLPKIPMTRGIVVSDGDATDWGSYWDRGKEEPNHDADAILLKYKEAGIPIDTVHIGDSTGGEELLRKIAKLTGGIYCKFTDVGSFATAFAYLTPGYRAMLTSGRLTADEIGASEINL